MSKMVALETDDMRAAAVLMGQGWSLIGAEPGKRGRWLNFKLCASQPPNSLDIEEQAQEILTACSSGYNLSVHLGTYERCLEQVRNLIRKHKEDEGYE